MKARIARTIVAVTALVILVLGVPFAIVAQRFFQSRATVELQRAAAEAIAELTIPLDGKAIAAAAEESDAPSDFSVYNSSGAKIYGSGPLRADVNDANQLVVISPITDRNTEEVVGSVRVSRPRSDIDAQARTAWALMALAGIGGLGVAVVVARREAKRLVEPISKLVTRAELIGSGHGLENPPIIGIPELDTLADALSISEQRLQELLAREREFSANASHQLRTPLTALKVNLESGDIAGAMSEADRLEATIDHMLALARNSLPTLGAIDIGSIVRDISARWEAAFGQADRQLITNVESHLPPVQSRSGSIEQSLDILIDNSLKHGSGVTRLEVRRTAGGVVVQISDDGVGIAANRQNTIFDRGDNSGTRIGLPLARTLIEAAGGRLLLTDTEHAEFRIVLAASV